MLSLLRWLVLRLAAVRWIFKTIGGLAVIVPLALLLKVIGLPLLGVAGVLALPVLFLLFIFGLPIFLVLLAGGAAIGLLFAVLSVGFVALKIGLLVVLPVFLIYKLASWIFGRGNRHGGNNAPSDGPTTDPIDGVDPL